MAIYEVRVNRVVSEQYADICVRAKSMKQAKAKALKEAKNPSYWECLEDHLEADEPEKLDFEPDCVVVG
jgi:hypothetical protein